MWELLFNWPVSGRSALFFWLLINFYFGKVYFWFKQLFQKVPEKAISAMVVDEETEELLAQQVRFLYIIDFKALLRTWMVKMQENVWIYFKNLGSNGDDRSPPVHLWFSPQTQVSISFHCKNKFICFSICLFDMCYKSSWQVCYAWPARSGQEQHCEQPPWLRQPGQPWQEEEQEESSLCRRARTPLKNQNDLVQVSLKSNLDLT